MRRSCVLTGLLLAALIAQSASAASHPASGTLLSDEVRLDGRLLVAHDGELLLDASRAPGTPVTLQLSADRIVAERHWREWQVVQNPLGGPVRTALGEPQTEELVLEDATLRLAGLSSGGILAFHTVGPAAYETETAAGDLAIEALKDPLIVPSRPETGAEAGGWSLRADGDRFALAATGRTVMSGDLALYAWGAILEATDRSGSRTFATGRGTGEATGPTRVERHEWDLFRLEGATGTLVVEPRDATPLTLFARAPTLLADGALRLGSATGTLHVGGEGLTPLAEPVALVGSLALRPEAAGPVRETNSAPALSGSAQRYDAMRIDVEGKVESATVAGRSVATEDGVPIAAAAAAASVAVAAALWLLPAGVKYVLAAPLAPLYAKVARSRVLENEARERIFRLLEANPGLNLSAVQKHSGLAWGVTVYHLATLEKNGLVTSRSAGRDRCFFPGGRDYNGLAEALMAVTNRRPVRILAKTLAREPWLSQTDVVERSGLPQRTVSYNLGKLAEAGLVERRHEGATVRYRASGKLVAALEIVGAHGGLADPKPHAPAAEQAASTG